MFSFKRINVFSGELLDSWILGKFAKILKKEYSKYGIKTTLSYKLSDDADFNHSIIYLHYQNIIPKPNDVMMITHIDTYAKLELLRRILPKVRLGICMSKEQMNKLIYCGLDKNKLCYINPAHDGIIPVKKYVIGLASRVYIDGRKNEHYFNKLADILDCRYFKFKIMGAGWDEQINYMKEKGFATEYYPDFDYDIYTQKFFSDMDYYLYMGLDEGQMGFVDAQSAGVKTIVTAQGYHLDSNSPITHPFTTYDELEQIFLNLQKEKAEIVNTMQDWTWENYALKHLQIFEYLYSGKIIENKFKDGLNSLLYNLNNEIKTDEKVRDEYLSYLKREIKYKKIKKITKKYNFVSNFIKFLKFLKLYYINYNIYK